MAKFSPFEDKPRHIQSKLWRLSPFEDKPPTFQPSVLYAPCAFALVGETPTGAGMGEITFNLRLGAEKLLVNTSPIPAPLLFEPPFPPEGSRPCRQTRLSRTREFYHSSVNTSSPIPCVEKFSFFVAEVSLSSMSKDSRGCCLSILSKEVRKLPIEEFTSSLEGRFARICLGKI